MRTRHIAPIAATASILVFGFGLAGFGCEPESRWADQQVPASADDDTASAVGPEGSGAPIHGVGGTHSSSSTLGRARDSAERTRDRLQQRDSEIGDLADTIFD